MTLLNFPRHPAISIVLPTYNRAQHLSRCIDSVMAQTWEDWELIIVDDGSSDRTFEVVQPYVQGSDQIRYLYHCNRGAGLSRNAGIQASFGAYLTFIDSDDRYQPEHLASRLSYMQAHPTLDLITGGFSTEEEIWVADYFHPGQTINIQDCVIGPTFFGKRQVFFDLQGFTSLKYGEDTELWERAQQRFQTQRLTDPKTYVYTRAQDSTSKQFTSQVS